MALALHGHSENPLLDYALSYAARGWHVFPLHAPGKTTACDCGDEACSSPGKHPWTRNGLKDASVDAETIRGWWRKWPRANIGVAAGPSHLLVLDVDPRHGGVEALIELVNRHGMEGHPNKSQAMAALIERTLTSETGGGGEHYVYQMPEGSAGIGLTNRTDLDNLRGLDVRAAGGYFVAPPSLHMSGARYQWRAGANDPAALPEWLGGVIRRRANRAPATSTPVRMFTPARNAEQTGAYWLGRALSLANEGSRNSQGLWLACQLRDDGVPLERAEAVLLDYAAQVPQDGSPYTEREALNSLRQAYQRPARDPARNQTANRIAQHLQALSAPLQRATGAAIAQDAMTGAQPDGERTSPRFQFLTDEEVENMPPPQWLIGGMLVEGSLSVVFGEFGSYKSFLTMDWAMCVATGHEWHGQPVKQGSVAYIAGEGIGGLGKRLKAWKAEHRWRGSAPIYLLGQAPQLLDASDVWALREAVAALPEPPSLIIIDTLARSMVGGDENSAQDMGMAVRAAETLRADTGAHILLVHHKPAGASKARGSTALPGAADTLIDVTKEGQSGQHVITVTCAKQKDAAPFESHKLRFKVVLVDESGQESSGVLVEDESRGPRRPALPSSATRVLGLLRTLNDGNGARRIDLLKPFVSGGMSERSLDNGLTVLEQGDYAENIGGFWRLTRQADYLS